MLTCSGFITVIFFFYGKKSLERFTNLRVILAQGPC